jgi:branched-chain amino acid aminotransferase
MNTPSGVAYINREFVPISEAKISVLDWGFLRSDATYDVVHVWKGRFFRLDTHIDRFIASLEKIYMTLPVSRQELEKILAECVIRSGHEDAYVEMILTHGVSPTFSRDPRDAINQLICFAIPFGWILRPEEREDGLSVFISDIQRISSASIDPRVKNYHWLDLVMGLYDAYEHDAKVAILTDAARNITEGPGFNVFTVKDNQIVTPDAGVLEGITRRSALEIARELNFDVVERPISRDEPLNADEVFATSTAGGIMPITKLNGRDVGSGSMGPMTRQIHDAYWAKHLDDNRCSTFTGWGLSKGKVADISLVTKLAVLAD